MARVDRRRAQREARNARASGTRRARGGSRRGTPARVVEDTLFFTRLRRQAKWAFVLMVLVFSVGFVFLGVGSGGLDLGQLIRDTFGSKGGGGPSISSALKDVDKHPRQASAYRHLADAYERKGRSDDAINALRQYVTLAPKDTTQVARLGKLQANRARGALQEAQAAFIEQQTTNGGSTFGASPTSTFGQSLGTDPINQAVSTKVSARLQQATSAYRSDAAETVATFQKLAKLQPNQDSYFQLARTAEEFQDTKTALAAYRKLAQLVTDPATKRGIRAKIASLQASAARPGG